MIRKLQGTEDSENNGNEKILTTRGDAFGCDAMIMLMGEEDSLITGRTLDEEGNVDITSTDSAKQEEEEMLMNLIMSDAGLPGGGDSKYNNNKSIIREYQTFLFGSLFYLFGIFHRLHVLLYFIFRSVVQKFDDSTLLEHR